MRKRLDRPDNGVLSPRLRLSVVAVAVPVGAGVAARAGLPVALQRPPRRVVMLPPSVGRCGRRGHVLPQSRTLLLLLPGCAGRRRVDALAAAGLRGWLWDRQAVGSVAMRAGLSGHGSGVIVRVPPGKGGQAHKNETGK